jgi:hypothetical protein
VRPWKVSRTIGVEAELENVIVSVTANAATPTTSVVVRITGDTS